MSTYTQTFTLTFAEVAESHKGMEMIGEKAKDGFSVALCKELAEKYNGEFIQLDDQKDQPEAAIVIFRNGLQTIFGIDPNDCYNEQEALPKDAKAWMKGRVVNKIARHNLCFADYDQEADYENKKGTIIDFKHLPLLSKVRVGLQEKFGEQFANLNAEGNYYYDVKSTYIGYHQDDERAKVVGVRLGADFDLHFKWWHKGEAQEDMSFTLKNGDIYIMSREAVGLNWKRRSVPWHVRHAAGDIKVVLKHAKKPKAKKEEESDEDKEEKPKEIKKPGKRVTKKELEETITTLMEKIQILELEVSSLKENKKSKK